MTCFRLLYLLLCFGAVHFATSFKQKKPVEEQVVESTHISIDVGTDVGWLNKFWRSTGLCPPDPHQEAYKFLLSKDFHLNVAYIGSLPYNGITQVRIHWLLALVHLTFKKDGTRVYNYVHLDEVVRWLRRYDLRIGFELMGNPSQVFSDFENATQVTWWKELVENLAKHYIDMYGEEYVSKWNFETWNEPDHHDFDGLNFTIQGFLNYYDACAEGLKSASTKLKLGGPGGSCHVSPIQSPICWALLKHCMSGKSFFSGDLPVTLDFISFHKKVGCQIFFLLL